MLSNTSFDCDTLIVGAGLSGLVAGARLHAGGKRVVIVDKGRGVGGRMATRRLADGAVADHGAQFFTVRDPGFAAIVESWKDAGLVREWARGFTEPFDGHPRWCGQVSMNAIAKHLATGLDVRTQVEVVRVQRALEGWELVLRDGSCLRARSLLLTPPLPQCRALLEPEEAAAVPQIEYERCIAVMARLARPSRIADPGARQFESGVIAFAADNQRKGISSVPCITLHGSAQFSLEYWETDRRAAGYELLRAAAEWIDGAILDFEVHAWRYAKPIQVHPERCVVLSRYPLLVLAGDAFAGPRVEGAVLSGAAAAKVLE